MTGSIDIASWTIDSAVGFHALDLQQALLDVRRVVADRVIEDRHDGDREQREGRSIRNVIQTMPTRVSAPCASGCSDSDQRARGRRFEVDRVHQSPGADLIAKRDRQPLGVTEQIAAKVEDDRLLEPRLQIARGDRQRIREQREDQSGADGRASSVVRSMPATQRASEAGGGCEPSTLSMTIFSGHGTSSPTPTATRVAATDSASQPQVPAEIRKHAERTVHLSAAMCR